MPHAGAGMLAQPLGMSALTWAKIHQGQEALKARGRSWRTALTPIPEAPERGVCYPECSGNILSKPDWESGSAPFERTDSDRSEANQASTPRHRETSGAERAGGAAERTADKRELPAIRSWPEHREMREARGSLTLRGSADPQAEGRPVVCRLRDDVLTLGMVQRAAAGETTEVEVAEVPVEELVVGLQRGHANMFTIATVYNNESFDEIYCFCADPVRRDRWIAVFRRMGVAICDMRD